jgi:GntR family transcriptional regulator
MAVDERLLDRVERSAILKPMSAVKEMSAAREPIDLDRRGLLRYVQLAAHFRRKIDTGEWAKGAQIPTVVELSKEFGVARETIRQSLGVLQNDGLIERHRAKGTFVTGNQREQLWCDLHTDYFGLLQSREGAEIELISEVRQADLSASLDVGEPMGTYRHLKRRHWRNGEPYMFADVFIAEELVSQIPRSAFTRKTALKIVADIPGMEVAEVEQFMTIGSADLEVAEMLRMQLAAPVANINRYALNAQGSIMLFARGTYRGDIVRLNIKTK